MSRPSYLAPCVKITELICILDVVRSAVFVVTFPVCSIQFPPTVRRILIGCYFFGLISTIISDYVTVCPTGILLPATKWIVFVPFFTFPGNPSASHPNSFDSPFFKRSLVFCYFVLIQSFYRSISPMYGSINVLVGYQGKVSSSIFVAMLCVTIGMIGTIWFIYSCVTIGISLGAILGGLPGLLFSCITIGTSLCTTLGGLTGFLFCVCTLVDGVWCGCCLVGYQCVTGALTWSGSTGTSCLSFRCPLCLLVVFFKRGFCNDVK